MNLFIIQIEDIKMKKILLWLFSSLLFILLIIFLLQFIFCHMFNNLNISYNKIDIHPILSKELPLTDSDYNTLLLQTGLGKDICQELLKNKHSGIPILLFYQNEFFKKKNSKCNSVCSWFVKTDILLDESMKPCLAPEILESKPGDILISFSTHSFGWRHGHAALVLDKNKTLESRIIGENSVFSDVNHFREYSNYVLLRKKNASSQQIDIITNYANTKLNNIPYRLCGKLFYKNHHSCNKKGFGVNCSSLIWYAYDACGINLNSDGGFIVTPKDIFNSEYLEIVQIYGINPQLK